MPTLSLLQVWLRSLRLGTLPLALIAIVVGAALAWRHGAFEPQTAGLALLTAALLQLLTNLANDYGDVQRGCDAVKTTAPLRGLQTGAITPRAMRWALATCAMLCVASGSALIAVACASAASALGFVALGLSAILAALGYTLGRHAYGYLGLGDLSVLAFFGWVGVIGSYYLQAGSFEAALLLPATASGLLAISVLNVNNLRDIDSDPLVGKRTLAVRLGPTRARRYQALLLGCALLCLALFVLQGREGWPGWLFMLAGPLLLWQARTIRDTRSPAEMAPLLGRAVRDAVIVQLLFAAGLVFG